EELARSGAFAVGADLSLGMLRAGRARPPSVCLVAGDALGRAFAGGPSGGGRRASVWLVAGGALALPFADGAFDAVTISFGLRNVVDVPGALRELARVTRPGGGLVGCEFSRPTAPPPA